MAMAEFSVGRGFLISQVAASIRPKDAPTIGLHADNNWLPAPFPADLLPGSQLLIVFMADLPANRISVQKVAGFGEIIVTSQLREQALFDVPMAVSAVTAEEIQDYGVVDLASLQTTVSRASSVAVQFGFTTETDVASQVIGTVPTSVQATWMLKVRV